MNPSDRGRLRIGELSRRVGVSPEVLRAWERRYGLLSPARTDGGFRLYGEQDERRVRLMLALLGQGVSAAQAAERTLDQVTEPAAPPLDATGAVDLAQRLRAALDAFEDSDAHTALDRLFGAYPLERVLAEAILPYLHQLGERWARGEVSVAQEHFASALLRGRLLALARGWGSGQGPRALLACAPGDQHELGLICFALVLRARGWRITYLGPDTPPATLLETAGVLSPAAVVISLTQAELAEHATPALDELSRLAPLWLAGPGASSALADGIGARHLEGDPIGAAAAISREDRPS